MNICYFKQISAIFALFFIASCVPTTPTGTQTSATPAPSASVSAPLPSAEPTAEATASPTPAETPEPEVSLSPEELTQVAKLELMFPNRYLNAKGETVQLQVRLLDAAGNPIDIPNAPLQYKSSRPADFSVSANGLVTALVDYGFSGIQVSLAGLQTQQIFSVSAGGSSTGNTGASSPTQEDVQGVVAFQF